MTFRMIITGQNSQIPRDCFAATNSGKTPESVAGGPRQHDEVRLTPRKGVGTPHAPSRRPPVCQLKGVAIAALWDSGEFGTHEIAHVLGLHGADVARVLDIIRDQRRARR